MTSFQYKRAPITEAVVEFRSSPPITDDYLQKKAFKKLNKFYDEFKEHEGQSIQLKVNKGGTPEANSTAIVRNQFSSSDMTQLLTISGASFLVSQLAPYQGWDTLKERIIRDWDIWNKHVGFQSVNRIGVRYINRIDIPITSKVIAYEEYVNVYPSLPDMLNPIVTHNVNVKTALDDIDSILILNSSVVQSPVPNNIAIVLDFDIVRNYNSPQNKNVLFEFIELARLKKNEIFEACITDKARELFNS